MIMKKNYIFLADGFEELEALSVVDVLRRAGMDIIMVSINDTTTVTGAHGVAFLADAMFTDVNLNDADWLICPGGMPGATNLHECDALTEALRAHAADGGNIAAICAAPAVVLAQAGILKGKNATCYPGFEEMCKAGGAKMAHTPVVTDGNIITANGPATAVRFALAIVKETLGEPCMQDVAGGMLLE